MRALPGVAQLRGLLRMLWKDVSGRQGGKCRVGEERKEGEGGIPRRSFLARFSEPKKQKRETGDARCITGMMDDHTCRQLRRKRSLSIYKKLPSIVTTRTILRYLDLHKFVDAFTSKKKNNLFRVQFHLSDHRGQRKEGIFKIRQSIIKILRKFLVKKYERDAHVKIRRLTCCVNINTACKLPPVPFISCFICNFAVCLYTSNMMRKWWNEIQHGSSGYTCSSNIVFG